MGPKHETQRTISDWAVETFGHALPERAIGRMVEECHELEKKMLEGGKYEDLADEIADIFITGYTAMSAMGFDVLSCIDHKMQINRGRRWRKHGDGTGQHIKEE